MMTLEVVGGDTCQVRLGALLPEGKLVFSVKALDLGSMPVGVPHTSIVTLKNIGVHDATFQVRIRTGLPAGLLIPSGSLQPFGLIISSSLGMVQLGLCCAHWSHCMPACISRLHVHVHAAGVPSTNALQAETPHLASNG